MWIVLIVAALWLVVALIVWMSVLVARRLILDEAIDEVGRDDPLLLEAEVRRRLGEAASPHEIRQVLKPELHGRPPVRG